MPQIWLTYEEIGDMYGRSASEGRDFAIKAGLDRRQCSDGLSRAKLPDGAARAFMISFARQHSRVAFLDFAGAAAHAPTGRATIVTIEGEAQAMAG